MKGVMGMHGKGVLRMLTAGLVLVASVLLLLMTPVLAVASDGSSASTSTASGVTHLDGTPVVWIVGVLFLVMFMTALVLIFGRRYLFHAWRPKGSEEARTEGDPNITFVRSWLAMTLVGGLLVIIAVSFLLDDSTLRNTAIGALLASASAAVAFYFAGKAADDARKDIMSGWRLSVPVPDLTGLTPDQVEKVFSGSTLWVGTLQGVSATSKVDDQDPKPYTMVPQGTKVVPTFK